MKYFMIAFIALNCFAQTTDITNGLTDKQKAELALKAAEMRDQSSGVGLIKTLTDPENMNQYVTLGENIGKAASACAKELGMAANELSQTPLGKIVIVLVAWKVMGSDAMVITRDLIDIVVLVPILIAWICLCIWHYRRRVLFRISSITYEGKTWYGSPIVKEVKYNTGYDVDGEAFLSCAIFIVVSLAILVKMLN